MMFDEPDTATGPMEASPRIGSTRRALAAMSMNIQPPGKLDFHSTNLPQMWRRWKEELELYLDIAMNDQ